MANIVLRAGVLAAALVQILFPMFVNPFRDGQDAVRAGAASQIEPAGYAFSIWGAIYLLALVYSVWQLTPRGRRDPATARAAPLALALYAGSSLWLAAVEWGPLWATMPILAIMAACACAALLIARGGGGETVRYWAFVAPFGLYAGWTLCATFVNIAEVAPQYGFARFGLSIEAYGALSIAAATVLGAIVLAFTRGEISFAATLIWALAAIVVAGRMRGAAEIVILAAGVGLAIVVIVTFALKLFAGRDEALRGDQAERRAAQY